MKLLSVKQAAARLSGSATGACASSSGRAGSPPTEETAPAGVKVYEKAGQPSKMQKREAA